MEIGHELRSMGWVQGVDFDYAYYPEKYDSFSHGPIVKRHSRFTFYNDSNASYFMFWVSNVGAGNQITNL